MNSRCVINNLSDFGLAKGSLLLYCYVRPFQDEEIAKRKKGKKSHLDTTYNTHGICRSWILWRAQGQVFSMHSNSDLRHHTTISVCKAMLIQTMVSSSSLVSRPATSRAWGNQLGLTNAAHGRSCVRYPFHDIGVSIRAILCWEGTETSRNFFKIASS